MRNAILAGPGRSPGDPPGGARLDVLSPEEMGRADALAPLHGAPGPWLMENAGRAVARSVRRHFRPLPVLVLCGPGNNGGDGYVAARLLAEQGWPVRLAALAPPRAGSDAASAAARWTGKVHEFSPEDAARAGLVIDAVYGAGLSRDLDGLAAATLAAARQVVAVDVPSGLDGATGAVRGFAPQAALTVTFFRLKPGHLVYPGRALCGVVDLADIGLPEAVLQEVGVRTWRNAPGLWRLPAAQAEDHKYVRGHVTVLGGAEMTGAARLAALAARHGGAGLVSILAPPGGGAPYRAGEAGTIVSEASLDSVLEDRRRRVFVCGPGMGLEAARAAMPVLLRAARRVVADADALTAFAGTPELLRGAAILTPHPGEFARLFGAELGALAATDRLEAARRAAALCGVVVVLKGPDTIIAAPDGRAAINDSAPSSLATAGSGDVLAGLAGAMLARGLDNWAAGCAAVWLHGRAGHHAGRHLVAEDLPEAIGPALDDASAFDSGR